MTIICSECGKEIDTVHDYWKRIRDGREVFVCPGCAAGMVDERTGNGLLLVIGTFAGGGKAIMKGARA